MKNTLLAFALLSTFFLISCGSTPSEKNNNAKACNTGSVRLTADFPTGRMNNCKVLADNEFLITLMPENTPINSSPWYAFKIEADQPTKIKITMRVKGDLHRYPPKFSYDTKNWKLLDHTLKNERLVMKVNASTKPIYIAGQEIINNQYYIDWAKKLKSAHNITHDELGQSTQGLPIYKIESKGKSNEWLVIFGRMHPPEVTGALALFPFVETLLNENTLATDFRRNYNLLVIPNINPDGVLVGNWRHNANGLDLNRDWIKFSQIETQQIHAYLQDLVAKGQKIKFAIDFHSTRHDVFYTMPTDYGMENKYFVKHWLGALDDAMPNFKVVTKPGNTLNNGVSKQYFADNYNVHAITYEMGDNTGREQIKLIAENAANTLMETLLSDINHNEE